MSKKKLVENYIEKVWNNKDLDSFSKLTAIDFHYNFAAHKPRNREQFIALLMDIHKGFPDWHIKIDEMISENNKVVIRWSGDVTHTGVYMGIPASGKKVHVCGTNIYRIENELLAEEWEQTNSLSWLKDMGILK